MFVLDYRLREFLLSAFANRFELRCELKQLMLITKSALVKCFYVQGVPRVRQKRLTRLEASGIKSMWPVVKTEILIYQSKVN